MGTASSTEGLGAGAVEVDPIPVRIVGTPSCASILFKLFAPVLVALIFFALAVRVAILIAIAVAVLLVVLFPFWLVGHNAEKREKRLWSKDDAD